MATEASMQASGLQWKWVVLGVIAGLAIVGSSYFIVAPTFHSNEIQALVMLVGYAVTGAIVGYFSPGVTITEATIAGTLVLVLMYVLLKVTGAEVVGNQAINLLLMILGVAVSWVGGWVGEKLQGSDRETGAAATGFQWKWVAAGVVLGLALNVLFVFLIAPRFKIDMNVCLVAFIVSFVVTGFLVGFKSPGITLKEPAVAGLIAVVVDWLFLQFGIKLVVPAKYIVAGLAIGFMFSLFGAWLGEKYQESTKKA